MKGFNAVLYAIAFVAIVTGTLDLLLGVKAQLGVGVTLSDEDMTDAVLNSQIRFLGTVWCGLGILICVCLKRLSVYAGLLKGVLAIIFIGGVGRIISLIQFGFPDTTLGTNFVVFAISVEIVGMPLLWWWLNVLLARNDEAKH